MSIELLGNFLAFEMGYDKLTILRPIIFFERTHPIFENCTTNVIHSLPELISESSCRFIFNRCIVTIFCVWARVSIVKMHAFVFRYYSVMGINRSCVHKVHPHFECVSGFQNVFGLISMAYWCHSFISPNVHLGVQKIVR